MPAVIVSIIFFILSLLSVSVFGQTQNVRQRTQELIAEDKTQEIVAKFNKTKHKVKEKYGVRVEVYVEIRSEAAVKRPEEYTGVYRVDGDDTFLELRVASNGAVEGNGKDGVGRDFTLTNGKIEGGLLTATKAYASGGTLSLEGAFINLTTRSGKSPDDAVLTGTTFGLGVIGQLVSYGDRVYGDKVFYARQR